MMRISITLPASIAAPGGRAFDCGAGLVSGGAANTIVRRPEYQAAGDLRTDELKGVQLRRAHAHVQPYRPAAERAEIV